MADNYNNFTYIPTDEASQPLICRVLGVRSSSVPYVLGSKKINRYARRKPYKNIGSDGVQLYGVNGNDETLIIQHNFGLTPKLITTPPDSVAALTDYKQKYNVEKWGQWSAPDPYDENDFKRMDDMCGYDKLAESHIQGLMFTDAWGESDSPSLAHNGLFKVDLSFNKAETSVRLDEIHYGTDVNAKYAEKYLTVMITNKNSVRWGMDWIVVQAKTKLGSIVRNAGTPIAGVYTLEFNLSNVTNAADLFGSYFLAVGLADKFTKATVANQYTVTSYQNSITGNNAGDIWLFRYDTNNYPTVTSERIPLKLYSFNMFGDRMTEAMLGKMQNVGVDKIKKYFDVPARIGVNSTPSFTSNFITKNGVSGVEVAFKANIQVESYVPYIEAEYRDKGYPALCFYVELMDAQTNQMLTNEVYAVVFQEGWSSSMGVAVNGTTIDFSSEKGEAQNLLAGTLQSLDNAKLLKNGIFIPCDKSSVIVGASVYVMGGASIGADAIYYPSIVDYPFGNTRREYDFGEKTISK